MKKGKIGFAHEFYLSRYLSPAFDLRLNSNGGYQNNGVDFQDVYLNLRWKLLKETSAVRPYLVWWWWLYVGQHFTCHIGDGDRRLCMECRIRF
jgi:hypothetical protein